MIGAAMRIVPFHELDPVYGIPYSRAHVDRLEKTGEFPRRVKLGEGGPGAIGWVDDELADYIAKRVAARDRADPQQPKMPPGQSARRLALP
jgi:prophage regulatory protein